MPKTTNLVKVCGFRWNFSFWIITKYEPTTEPASQVLYNCHQSYHKIQCKSVIIFATLNDCKNWIAAFPRCPSHKMPGTIAYLISWQISYKSSRKHWMRESIIQTSCPWDFKFHLGQNSHHFWEPNWGDIMQRNFEVCSNTLVHHFMQM